MMLLPENLEKLSRYETGPAWLNGLPGLIDELAQLWELRIGAPYSGSSVSCVMPVEWERGKAVLKIQWPHEECRFEADALRVWDGDGAVRLLLHDPERHALLLERCEPGHTLAHDESSEPISVLASLLPRLWKPAGLPFKALTQEAADWARNLASDWEKYGRPCEARLIDAAAEYLTDLPQNQGEQVLLHQDLHGDNVLCAEREPWLVIDPKPLVGEREFSAVPIVRSFEFGQSRQAVVGRMDRLCETLALDRDRVRGWTIAQTMAWSFDSSYSHRHFQTVRWLLEA